MTLYDIVKQAIDNGGPRTSGDDPPNWMTVRNPFWWSPHERG